MESNGQITLKQLAEYVGLSPGTVSVVLNNAPRAENIPQKTKARIFEAAEKLNYRPHYFARSLRANQSFTVGVLVSELTGGYCAIVLNGIEEALSRKGYFYLATSHFHRDDLLGKKPLMLIDRQVDGIIAVDTQIRFKTELPLVTVSGHEEIDGVVNVVLNHRTAAELGIGHLHDLGHRRIALLKGQDFSTDTAIRWESINEVAQEQGIPIDERLTIQLEGDIGTPEIGYVATKRILERSVPFTALFAFNDVSAIGAIRALRDAGLDVPRDVSVLGFDDIYAAEFHNPALTTIRQPLFKMGEIAGETLLKLISKTKSVEEIVSPVTVEPEIIVRASTDVVRSVL
ncbi:MAG TPA: LacI family DNA-binding transcriptional regulator [Pyrinomonadaceae bacterium]|nr:LacI family DNA-binding transcriptional regulator [Pyrinomonadaceae bacterium]